MAGELHLRVVTPDRTLIDRKVAAVTFKGIDGSYGILPRHAPLTTALAVAGAAEITDLEGKKEKLFVSGGFAQVLQNTLTMVCEAGEFVHEIDFERAKAAEAKAREKMTGLDKFSEEFLKVEASLRKALTREMLAQRGGS